MTGQESGEKRNKSVLSAECSGGTGAAPHCLSGGFTEVKIKSGQALRVAAYIRVSTDHPEQEDSYELQERYFTKLLNGNQGWIFVGIYSDYGVSGTTKERRSGFQRLLRHCQEGKVDRIVCKSISRFARNTRDFIMAVSTLRNSGVTILFEKENLDTADFTSEFILTTLGAIAQEESRSVSENIRWGFNRQYLTGEAQNCDIYGYQYVNETKADIKTGCHFRQLKIVKKEAEIVRRIFQEAAEGVPYTRIAYRLNMDQVPAPKSRWTQWHKRQREGGEAPKGTLRDELYEGWTGRHISQLIRLERYTGDVLLQKRYTTDYLMHKTIKNEGEKPRYLIENHHPAIISRKLFQEVQKVRNMNSKIYSNLGEERNTYPFSGKLVCAHCGRFYNTRNRGERSARPIWFCPSGERNNGIKICQAERVYEEQLVRVLRKAIVQRFGLLSMIVYDNVTVADILMENCDEKNLAAQTREDFVSMMISKLEAIQHFEAAERERVFLRKQIASESGRQSSLAKKLRYMEQYWYELDKGYEWRNKALNWMKKLPSGWEGTVMFLNGFTDGYLNAFVLSVSLYSPLNYNVHWFDDTNTEVTMESNVEDGRRAAAGFEFRETKGKENGHKKDRQWSTCS